MDVGDRDAGVEAPSHSNVDLDVAEHDVREPGTEPDRTHETAVPSAVVDLEPAHDGGADVGHVSNVPRPVPSVRALWALGVVVAAARWWFSHNRIMFHMTPDEPAQLAMARLISGGLRWNMFDHSTWRPGMAVLLAPLFWFTDDTSTIVHGALLIGAALGGIAAVILARLATRLTMLSPTGCVLAAGAVAIAPASLSSTAFVWAEALVTVTLLATIWLMLRFYDDPRSSIGCATAAMAALGFTGHGRMLPLVPVVLVLLLLRCVMARAWVRGAVITAVAVGTTLLSYLLADAIYDAAWDRPGSSNTVGTVIKRLPKVLDNLQSALGQAWYQLAATAGLSVIGTGVLLVRAARRRGRSVPDVVIRDARLVLALTAPLILVSIVFMSGRTRTDHQIYGRYNDAVMWPMMVVGIAWLARLRYTAHRFAAAAVLIGVAVAIVAAGVGVHAVAGDALADSVGVRPMVSGLMPIIGSASHIAVTRVVIVAVAGLVVLTVAALSSRRGAALAVVGLALLAVGGVRTRDALSLRLNSWAPATQVVEIDELIPHDAPIGFRFVPAKEKPGVSWDEQRRRAQLYQFALPHHSFERDYGTDDDIGPYVFAPDQRQAVASCRGQGVVDRSHAQAVALGGADLAPTRACHLASAR